MEDLIKEAQPIITIKYGKKETMQMKMFCEPDKNRQIHYQKYDLTTDYLCGTRENLSLKTDNGTQ